MRTFIPKSTATLLSAIVCGLLHCNSIGAQDMTIPRQPLVVTGSATNGYQLEISTTNGTFAISERIELRMTLRNVSSNALSIKVQDDLKNYSFRVIGPQGNEILPTAMGNEWLHPTRFYHQSSETLDPGQVFSQSVPLEKMFTMTNAGEYTIQVWRDTDNKRVTTDQLKIRVVEPPLH